MRNWIVIVVLLLSAAAHAEVYRWVDKSGLVHYSDHPQPGAEEVALPKYRPVSQRPIARTQPRKPANNKPQSQRQIYQSLAVAAPAADETLWNIQGTVNAALALEPALQNGHQVRVYLDGRSMIVPSTGFQLQDVYRGSHVLQAEVLDANGGVLIRSQQSTFHVQQTSIIKPR